jgi:hypothetical protein
MLQLSFYNYALQRIDTSAELKTPFQNWEETTLTYTHAGTPTKFECNAKFNCAKGHEFTANLKVGYSLN